MNGNITETILIKVQTVAAAGSLSSAYFAMTDAVAISLISSIGTLILGIFTVVFAYKSKVASETGKTVAEETSKAIDGHLSEYKAMAKKSFTAEGVLLEKVAEAERKSVAEVAHADGVAEVKAKFESIPPKKA